MDAGLGDDDGPVPVQELTPSVGIAETFGKRQGRGEPLDCFAHVGVVQHGCYGRIWCRAVLLQHRIGGYQCFPGRLTRHKISDRANYKQLSRTVKPRHKDGPRFATRLVRWRSVSRDLLAPRNEAPPYRSRRL